MSLHHPQVCLSSIDGIKILLGGVIAFYFLSQLITLSFQGGDSSGHLEVFNIHRVVGPQEKSYWGVVPR